MNNIGTNKYDIKKDLTFGAHASAVKDKSFVSQDLVEQLKSGNSAIFPLAESQHLKVLWLTPLEAIPRTGWKPNLI